MNGNIQLKCSNYVAFSHFHGEAVNNIGLLFPKSRFSVKLLLISMVSLLLEICQYVLAIGRADITDMITNICGGLFGIILYKAAIQLFRNKKRIDQVIIIFAAIITVIVVGGLLLLLAVN